MQTVKRPVQKSCPYKASLSWIESIVRSLHAPIR
jgi:hypothetical protein